MSEKTQPSRREFLARAGNGFGIVALADLLGSQTSLAAPLDLDRAANPYAVRVPHHAPRAKRCLFLYMPGGPSHIDLFDPKPRVAAMNGQPLPFAKPRLEREDRQSARVTLEVQKTWRVGPRSASCSHTSRRMPTTCA